MHILKPSQRVAVVARLSPVSQSASTATTGWIAMRDWLRLLAILKVGALGASATVDAKFQQASDGSGTGAKDISGTSITQLTKAGSDDNKEVLVNLHADQLDVQGGFTHVRFSVTVATAASLTDVTVLGFDPRHLPASDNDTSSVDEIVG